MKFIFWNVKKKLNLESIIEILNQESPDVLFLAEAGKSFENEHLSRFELNGYKHFENPGCDKIRIIMKKTLSLSLSRQSTCYSALKDNVNNVSIISVHLPSQMYNHLDGLKQYFRDFRSEIDSEFGSSLEKNILIIGDFNVNPFDSALIGFDGFSASNSIKLKKEAYNLKSKRALYYNPTWTLYNNSDFPGTFYYKRPSASSFDVLEHHFLDQVILSYSMSQKILFQNINILKKTDNHIFFDEKTNAVKISDHLPLIYEYKIA